MAINTKAVKNRIGSVKNTKKITKAMQMISAVKMQKAVLAAVNTRAYATLASELMEDLKSTRLHHPLSESRILTKELLILITSDRGLCGSYNANVLRTANEYAKTQKENNVEVSVLAIGKKSALLAKKLGLALVGLYEKLGENPQYESIYPISNTVIQEFKHKNYDAVTIIYTNYISGLVQKVESRRILPLNKQIIELMVKNTGGIVERANIDFSQEDFEVSLDDEYTFEPTKRKVLEIVLPMLVEIQIYQALLESTASEHSSRMIAMKNATESAGDMINELTLQYNKGRQAAITQEISEIVGGASALNN